LEATNPCVTGDTLIYTDQGLRRADELAAVGFEINVVTDARFGMDNFLPATHVFPTGIKPIYRLMTREGYELRLTEDHKVMTSRGWVETRHLQSGDRIHILNRKGGFGSVGTIDEGRVLGWLVGDGTVSVVRAVLSFFGDEKRELAPAFAEMVTNLVEKPAQRRAYPVGIIQVEERDEARIASDRLRIWAAQYGITEEKKHLVPSAVFAGSEAIQRGFIQALFTADGQVNDGGEKGCSVRLSASHLLLLKDVQRLLLNFGIASRIYENRRLAGYRPMPDGKGGTKEYFHQPQHDLSISKINLIHFANEIGFLTKAKQNKLADYLGRMVRGPYEESFAATVLVVEPDGIEQVYDLHQPDTHSFIANGMVVHNCGEQWLGPYENCCLGSVNLNEHCGPDGTVDWELLRQSVVTATRFLDDVVEANAYVPAVAQLREAAHRARRIGLGIMGLADLMYHVGVRYGSQEGQEFGAQVMEFVRYHAVKTSIELAEERGPFPAIEGSIYDMDNMSWTPPQTIVPFEHDWRRPEIQWDAIVDGIRQHGIRNAAQTTVAPTGTIATVAGCEGYGCEPVFALAYFRHVNDNGKDLKLTYASPRFDEALKKLGLGEEKRQEIVEQVMREGTCQHIIDIPQSVRDTFVVSGDITAEEHVRMQGALQAFVDNSLSKTVNFPEGATEEDVATAYMLAWELGCKGITVYVTGSREKVVLETKATAEKKEAPVAAALSSPQGASTATPPLSATFTMDTKKPRPRALTGKTYKVDTPVGKAFLTINENGGEQPFEAFINTAKAGSETAAVSEAIGRLISYILRLQSSVKPVDRMREIVRQLMGIGGGRSLGFGPNRVRSLPDGIGQGIDLYLREKAGALPVLEEKINGNGGTGHKIEEEASLEMSVPAAMKIGDLCPECGEAAVVNEEGCRKCYACGFSEC
jgi:ribonucleotide reductase alpha subunit